MGPFDDFGTPYTISPLLILVHLTQFCPEFWYTLSKEFIVVFCWCEEKFLNGFSKNSPPLIFDHSRTKIKGGPKFKGVKTTNETKIMIFRHIVSRKKFLVLIFLIKILVPELDFRWISWRKRFGSLERIYQDIYYIRRIIFYRFPL